METPILPDHVIEKFRREAREWLIAKRTGVPLTTLVVDLKRKKE